MDELFNEIYNLFQQILEMPDHECCKLCLGKAGAGYISHPIKETLYFSDDDDLYYRGVEWETLEEGLELLSCYIGGKLPAQSWIDIYATREH